jgi:hypothetical protein
MPSNFESGATTMMHGSTCTAHSPVINHIIMLCGFDYNSVMVDYINQEQWTTLNDVVSIGVNEPNTFLMVKPGGTTLSDKYTIENLFVESWDCTLDDMEEYEVVFEVEDAVTSECTLNEYCSSFREEVLILETDISVQSVSQWVAKDNTMYGGSNFNQWGATKQETLNRIENEEQMFVVYNPRMLIAVSDRTRVFDPG